MGYSPGRPTTSKSVSASAGRLGPAWLAKIDSATPISQILRELERIGILVTQPPGARPRYAEGPGERCPQAGPLEATRSLRKKATWAVMLA